jgi:hypothetical protein
MSTLVWKAPIRYGSPGDERAFFGWLQSIPGILSVEGKGRELHIRTRSNRVSATTLRELIALYERFQGDMTELARLKILRTRHGFVTLKNIGTLEFLSMRRRNPTTKTEHSHATYGSHQDQFVLAPA